MPGPGWGWGACSWGVLQAHPRGKLRGITSRPTPEGEIEGIRSRPTPKGEIEGIRSRPTPKGEIKEDQIHSPQLPLLRVVCILLECILVLYMSTLSTNNIANTIHNSIALILCMDHLNMPFNVHTTDKVTVSGFLTI